MQESNLFEYAVIRYVPRAEREEFLNVGVILYCPSKDFLNMKYSLDDDRIRAFYDNSNISELKTYLEAFKEVCCGSSTNSPIAKLNIASRFRWLTAARSTIVQTSKVHPGLCNDPMEKLEQLHAQLVGIF
ncbi:MAG: DUF3037 domain-containing protein [Chitinophagaceae bacterium]|nr:DUF3037 domain-containing protein [Chitinophagaceae bacterium]